MIVIYMFDFEPGSLLHHLPSYYHDLRRAIELASNIQHWNEFFDKNVDFISLKTCFDHGIVSTILYCCQFRHPAPIR